MGLSEILIPLILSIVFIRLYLVRSFTENVEDLYKFVNRVRRTHNMDNPCKTCRLSASEKAACCGCPDRLKWEREQKNTKPLSR